MNDMFTAERRDKLLLRDSPVTRLVTGNRAINIAAIRADGTYTKDLVGTRAACLDAALGTKSVFYWLV